MLGLAKKTVLFVLMLVVSSAVKGNSDTLKEEHIHMIAEIAPQFPGGVKELMWFITRNIRFPVMNRSPQFEGTIFVTFVVETDGSLTNIEILRSSGRLPDDADEQVIRLVENMPKWTPGKTRGKAVRTRFNLPVRFTLAG